MDREEKEIKYKGYRVVVQEANRRQGLRRMALMNEADDWLKERGYERKNLLDVPEDVRQDFMTLWLERSGCLAATKVFEVAGQVSELPLCDEFLELPDALISRWSMALVKLNPHWTPREEGDEDEDAEKKDEPPASG